MTLELRCLQVSRGAPKASLLWDFGLLDMSLRVKIEKVMLVHHICGLDEDTLARKVYDEQMLNKWPGLAQEAEDICRELEVHRRIYMSNAKKIAHYGLSFCSNDHFYVLMITNN